jgi:hypothetical protein
MLKNLIERIENLGNDDYIADCIIDALEIDCNSFEFDIDINDNSITLTIDGCTKTLTEIEAEKILHEI